MRDSDHKRRGRKSGGFIADLRDVFERYSKRTSVPHKRSIFLLIMVGALLRGWMLLEPITYDEARAFDLYISRPVGELITQKTDPLAHTFYALLAKVSVAIFGIGKVAIRLPAFIASILSMALFYLFTRAMFNRYIAMLVLALVASSGPLIEYGALAQGHSVGWMFMVLALVLGRHFVKENNAVSAILIGVSLGLGMWTLTAMIYPSLTVFIYLLLYILLRYQGSIRSRLMLLITSFIIFVALVTVLYFPILSQQGLAFLLDQAPNMDNTWRKFGRQHQDAAFDLWVAIADTTGNVIALLGIIAVLVSAFISLKYRVIMFAVALGAIPLVLLQKFVPPPPVWYYTLFLLHLGSGIAIFYLLKLIQEKFFTSLGKRTRTAYTSLIILFGLGLIGMNEIRTRITRFPEAASIAAYLNNAVSPEDKVYVDPPWDAPVKFHARDLGIERDRFQGRPAIGGWVFVIISPEDGQRPEQVLKSTRVAAGSIGKLQMVKDWPRIQIFAARYREGQSATGR